MIRINRSVSTRNTRKTKKIFVAAARSVRGCYALIQRGFGAIINVFVVIALNACRGAGRFPPAMRSKRPRRLQRLQARNGEKPLFLSDFSRNPGEPGVSCGSAISRALVVNAVSRDFVACVFGPDDFFHGLRRRGGPVRNLARHRFDRVKMGKT